MITKRFPKIDPEAIAVTRDGVHAYAGILGDWLKSCQLKRKHWWHVSLRPSLSGLTTGVVNGNIDFELELNLRECQLEGRTTTGEAMTESLQGQSMTELASRIQEFLVTAGIDNHFVPPESRYSCDEFSGYSSEQTHKMARVVNAVSASMRSFRAGIREEASPIQLWPHHFDLSMLWLPGDKVHGQDPADEEYADKQMNFGFSFGDDGIPEPYFYITAYPLPDGLAELEMPSGTTWRSDGFNGAVLLYDVLLQNDDPRNYLLNLWNGLLSAGREYMPRTHLND